MSFKLTITPPAKYKWASLHLGWDLCCHHTRRFGTAGHPGPGRLFVFDGDLIDRGAWGLEVLLLLAAWKVAAPSHVFLLRGNHETTFCSWVYGFRTEVMAKFPAEDGQVRGAGCQ